MNKKMKRISAISISFFLICGVFSVFPQTRSVAVSARSAVVIEQNTNIIIKEKSAHTRLPMASTTKIMTALIAIETCDTDSIFTVSESAANIEGTQIGVIPGDKIKLLDLLYMLMLRSANDVAEVIAENIAGSVETFAVLMNEKAKKLGLKNTNFKNPHGLPDDEHFTTAYDLAVITATALKDPLFAKIVSTKTAKIEYLGYSISNSNKLLSSYEYSTGVKTGFTKKAGRCLVSSATKNGVSLVCVTLNDANDWKDHVSLLEESFGKVSTYEIFPEKALICKRSILNGDRDAEFVNTGSLTGLAINGKRIGFEIKEFILPSLYAPISNESGYVRVYINGNVFCESKLVQTNTVNEKTEKTGFAEKFFRNFIQILIKVLKY